MTRKLAVVIGRFQITHRYHVDTVFDRARSYDSTLVLLGSAFRARDPKNPLLWAERQHLIELACEDAWGKPCSFAFRPLKDYPYPNTHLRWLTEVQRLVSDRLAELKEESGEAWEPVLVGVNKDASSFYLDLFPQWTQDVFRPASVDTLDVGATQLREMVFEERWDDLRQHAYPSTINWLGAWLDSAPGRLVQAWYEHLKTTKVSLAFQSAQVDFGTGVEAESDLRLKEAPWGMIPTGTKGLVVSVDPLEVWWQGLGAHPISPLWRKGLRFSPTLKQTGYDPVFYTTDNVVTWRGHVLLIRRRAHPGKGLWALPGGFLNKDEWIRDGAIRELQEETKVYFHHKGSRKRLRLHRDWCRESQQFDHPGRSLRGRTITTAYHWVIPDEYEVKISAEDNADRAQWFPIAKVLEEMGHDLFEDHQAIVDHMTMGAFS